MSEKDDHLPNKPEDGYAIKSCLEYLYDEALKHDYRLAAHLIGAAAEDIADRLDSTAAIAPSRARPTRRGAH